MVERVCRVFVVGIILVVVPALRAAEPEKNAAPAATGIRLGIVRSLFRDIPEPLIKVSMIPFQALMHQQTGFNCELIDPTEAYDLGKKLTDHQVEIAVFQGFEFAWVREKHPEMKPLVIAV